LLRPAVPQGDVPDLDEGWQSHRRATARRTCYLARVAVRYRTAAERLARLREALRELLPRLIDADTEKVVLFGSTARGDVGSASDLDLLVVRRDPRPSSERLDDLYRRLQPTIALDLLVYTPEELDAAQQNSSFLRTALREGEVLYDRSRALA
jgi:predicted nucleotidyltransferase